MSSSVEDTLAHLDSIDQILLERHYRDRAPVYLNHLARRLRVIETDDQVDLLNDAADAGQISETERHEAVLADLLLSGLRREDQAEIYVLVEIAIRIGCSEVERAAKRAAILTKLGRPVIALVAGDWITAEAEARASALGVLPILTQEESEAEEI